jgi:hypothetical protein
VAAQLEARVAGWRRDRERGDERTASPSPGVCRARGRLLPRAGRPPRPVDDDRVPASPRCGSRAASAPRASRGCRRSAAAPVIVVVPDAKPASSRARFEMLFEPGTRTVPATRGERRQVEEAGREHGRRGLAVRVRRRRIHLPAGARVAGAADRAPRALRCCRS